jgi:hypothetical protein
MPLAVFLAPLIKLFLQDPHSAFIPVSSMRPQTFAAVLYAPKHLEVSPAVIEKVERTVTKKTIELSRIGS